MKQVDHARVVDGNDPSELRRAVSIADRRTDTPVGDGAMLRICSIIFMLAVSFTVTTVAQAQSPEMPFAPTLTTRACVPTSYGDFQGRIHVRCSDIVNNIQYFALSTVDSNRTARVLAIIAAAFHGGRPLQIWFDATDLSGSAIGCGNADCRLISWIVAY